MAHTPGRSGPIGMIVLVMGVIFAVAGVTTYVLVASELSNENITVSADAKYFAGQSVNSPWTAWSEAETISKHALKATGGKTYAELFTSVVAFGVALLAAVLGIVLVLIGVSLRGLGRASVAAGAADPGY